MKKTSWIKRKIFRMSYDVICARILILNSTVLCVKYHPVIPINGEDPLLIIPLVQSIAQNNGKFHCEKCDIPICTRCVSSEEHSEHKAKDIMKTFQTKKETLQSDFQELEKSLFHEYQERAKSIKVQKAKLDEKSPRRRLAQRNRHNNTKGEIKNKHYEL